VAETATDSESQPIAEPPGSLNSDSDGGVFRALNDGGRRILLDALFAADGQTLTELCRQLPSMTRYGVMNHLRVLEEANLLSTVRDGRLKRHYLNPVPIRLVHDRWISKFTEPLISFLAQIQNQEGASQVPTPSHRYQAFIACTPAHAWQAIVDPAKTVQYFYGTSVQSSWEDGAEVRYLGSDGAVVASGEVLSIDPPSRVEMTFLPLWDPVLNEEGPAHMAWIVEDIEGLTRVTVEYYDLDSASKQASDFMEGIPFIVGGMKTLLETGHSLAPAD
jgi:uncharacterized protein YndB with AHSA1/START domain/DNA-binding transcriptional ArsR family regulator